MKPSRVLAMMASSEDSTIAARRWATSNARLVADRCDGDRDWDHRSVLSNTHRLEPLDSLAGPDLRQDGVDLVGSIRGKQEGRGPADDLHAGVAVHPLGGRVPARDDALEVLPIMASLEYFTIAVMSCAFLTACLCFVTSATAVITSRTSPVSMWDKLMFTGNSVPSRCRPVSCRSRPVDRALGSAK